MKENAFPQGIRRKRFRRKGKGKALPLQRRKKGGFPSEAMGKAFRLPQRLARQHPSQFVNVYEVRKKENAASAVRCMGQQTPVRFKGCNLRLRAEAMTTM